MHYHPDSPNARSSSCSNPACSSPMTQQSYRRTSIKRILRLVPSLMSLELGMTEALAFQSTRRSVLSAIATSPATIFSLSSTTYTYSGLDDNQDLKQDQGQDPAFCWNDDDGQCVRLNQLASVKSNLARAKMIVFDKDGTLGDCSSSLKRWAHHMTDRLVAALIDQGSSHIEQHVRAFHSVIGWDASKSDIIPSAALAAGTWKEQVEATAALLQTFGLPSHLATDWNNELGNLHAYDEPVISNLKEIILQCYNLGLKVAVCTSDDRTPTDMALSRWDIANLVEYTICGNEVIESKPSAMPLVQLCQATLVHPNECIMVGDTTADTGMARNAKTLLCIGVLTGSGTPSQLFETGADVVVPHVGHIPSLLLAMGLEQRQQSQSIEWSNDFANSILV